MDERFFQSGFAPQLAHVVEECGEVVAAAGKTQRWGPRSVNPLLKASDQEQNIAWLWRELEDLEGAVARLKATIRREYPDVGPN